MVMYIWYVNLLYECVLVNTPVKYTIFVRNEQIFGGSLGQNRVNCFYFFFNIFVIVITTYYHYLYKIHTESIRFTCTYIKNEILTADRKTTAVRFLSNYEFGSSLRSTDHLCVRKSERSTRTADFNAFSKAIGRNRVNTTGALKYN